MIYKLYVIQDVLVGFMNPMVHVNEEAAKRWYTEWLKTRAQNPKDMRFFYIGTFDDATGTVIGETPVQILGGGDDEGNL